MVWLSLKMYQTEINVHQLGRHWGAHIIISLTLKEHSNEISIFFKGEYLEDQSTIEK